MKRLKNHIIISLIAQVATNIFFIITLLIGISSINQAMVRGVSFLEFVAITNGALIIISAFSITYKNFGNQLLKWGYSNAFRGLVLIVLSVIVFYFASLILFGFHFVIKKIWIIEGLLNVMSNSYFGALTFYFAMVSTLMFFISNLERRSGNVFRLMAQSMGNSMKPKLVDRGFMFIDLNDATSLAEQLSGKDYAKLLRDCFRMLNELVFVSSFEVYQYVGDEAVITWKAETKNADLRALQLFKDFKVYLEEQSSAFANAYHLQPKFKCAIHSGEVVQSEIGRDVKHLVYHGDVLNTTARLLSQCHENKTDIIISAAAVQNKELVEQHFILSPAVYNQLKGKQQKVYAYTSKPIKQHNSKDFFLNSKMTNSRNKLKMNPMKIKTLFASLLACCILLTSCGGDNDKEQESKNNPQTESSVQVIRKSDLSLYEVNPRMIQNFNVITGRVVPTNSTSLLAEVQGRIGSGAKPFKTGNSFKKGQVILRINATEFSYNVQSQKNAFLNILTGIMPDLKADYPDNYQNWLSYVNSYDVSKSLPPLPEPKSDSEKYFVTSNSVYNTYYQIKSQENRLGKYTIVAPFDGSLTDTRVDAGGLVSPGQPLGTFISRDNYEIETAVSFAVSKDLKEGDIVTFSATEDSDEYEAKVVRINDVVDAQTQNIPIFFSVDNPELKAGLYLQGKVMNRTYDNAVRLPKKTIYRDETVHILQNDVIVKKPVELLNTQLDSITVRGLESGDKVILNTFDNPVSGLKITQ
ncbi:HlyD family efflux transporter periplasmic adaptor subunit [Aquimarina sp. U1-2]|uniref:HlyD family efflux transporter periplasmic adaptor subunit n=1 Tax=Aquimarina sp. U1-2 TaxID=2823141 RepID=UPI001AED0A16|nr:HlyD family efflux transporter periplasmic adaptor subunit [Aquimarina sp. U1-2]MBP2831086.1 HlyD family efflux transporter periplasmic adaptor subunit [Aquimarina sp. U1-2]